MFWRSSVCLRTRSVIVGGLGSACFWCVPSPLLFFFCCFLVYLVIFVYWSHVHVFSYLEFCSRFSYICIFPCCLLAVSICFALLFFCCFLRIALLLPSYELIPVFCFPFFPCLDLSIFSPFFVSRFPSWVSFFDISSFFWPFYFHLHWFWFVLFILCTPLWSGGRSQLRSSLGAFGFGRRAGPP